MTCLSPLKKSQTSLISSFLRSCLHHKEAFSICFGLNLYRLIVADKRRQKRDVNTNMKTTFSNQQWPTVDILQAQSFGVISAATILAGSLVSSREILSISVFKLLRVGLSDIFPWFAASGDRVCPCDGRRFSHYLKLPLTRDISLSPLFSRPWGPVQFSSSHQLTLPYT